MGLDMYAYVGRPGQEREYWDSYQPGEREYFDGGTSTVEKPRELAYWRKHPNLHGWMERLWQERGCPGGVSHDGEEPRFNGIELELDWDDIDRLEADILEGRLPATTGFFFGQEADDLYRDQDLDFCASARAELFLGQRVFYNSSW